jgi:pimeloyl-ACP methyl ester carboxylesterase
MYTTDVHLLQFEKGQLAFQKFGHGPAVLLAFHGFGQTHQVFTPVKKQLESYFTVFALNLFYHGNSYYTGDQPLSKLDWQRLIDAFLEAQQIERFSLLGFSLGGRFALMTAEGFADRVDQLILIAPDGITHSFWYNLATQSLIGRGIFRYSIRHLALLKQVGYALTRAGLLNQSIMRLVEYSLNTPEQQKRVYQSWTQFRRIHPNMTKLSCQLNRYITQVYFFTGAFDRIVPGTYILPLASKLRHFNLTIFKTGHHRLIELAVERLIKFKPQ